MELGRLLDALALEALVPGQPGQAIAGAYVSDLLSDVMANARPGAVWLTIQTHQNVVAVGSLLNLAAVIFTGGHRAEAETIAKAEAAGVPLYVSGESSYTLAGRLYEMGLR